MSRISAALAFLATPAWAATLELPAGATRTIEKLEALATYAVPIAPWEPAGMPSEVAEGQVVREAWQIPGAATTLQLLAPLREQLSARGYEILFECANEACGGFDFRFEVGVLPEPEMHVDLGDFRFLSGALRKPDGEEFVTLLVSRTSDVGFVQLVRVAPVESPVMPDVTSKSPDTESAASQPIGTAVPTFFESRADAPLAERLEMHGRAVLADLTFDTGSSRLADRSFPSLAELADYLLSRPDRSVTLVGHTDAEGGLAANISLSRARATAVRARLIESYGIPASQVEADGVGYLMPLSPNLTEEGRQANRRVEVVLISTE